MELTNAPACCHLKAAYCTITLSRGRSDLFGCAACQHRMSISMASPALPVNRWAPGMSAMLLKCGGVSTRQCDPGTSDVGPIVSSVSLTAIKSFTEVDSVG